MKLITKICLLIAIFIISASVALAGFNYDSAHNYFLIDSILKSGGSYILVGDAFNEIPNAFAVSNSLIFLNPTGQFNSSSKICQGGATPNQVCQKDADCGSGGLCVVVSRQMDKNNFATNQIKVQSPNTFSLSAGTGSLKLGSITGSPINIKMDNDFILQSSGLALIDLTSPVANTIYANKVLTNSLQLYSGQTKLSISPNSKLTISSGGTASVASGKTITFAGGGTTAPFCQKFSWIPVTDPIDVVSGIPSSGDASNSSACNSLVNMQGTARKDCCPANYLIYDLNPTDNKMVCCLAR